MRRVGTFPAFFSRERMCGSLIVLALFLFSAGPAMAHKVTVFAWVEGDRVHTESKFSRGRPVKQGRVIVYDLQGKKLLEGKTDEQGSFSFPVPQKTAMKIAMEAGTGHRAEWTVEADEVGGAASATSGQTAPETDARTSVAGLGPGAGNGSALTAGEVREIVDQALDRKLAPVIRMLAETRDRGPSVTEVIGGLGWILGLAGLATWLQSRKKRDGMDGKPPGSGHGSGKT
jgi:nickel transport protein